MNFFAGAFALGGLIAAAGPLVIHLLNRRRFRTVDWAAMEFLRQAAQRNRRVLHLRDLILLLLRVLCVLLFGLALARPYFASAGDEAMARSLWLGAAILAAFALAAWAVLTRRRATKYAAGLACLAAVLISARGVYGVMRQTADGARAVSGRAPVHAVLVLDNSLSMGYETLEGTLLERAKARAWEFVEQLPPDSRVSVIPLCGSRRAYSLDAYRAREDARDAIERIEVVDRAGTALEAIELAAQACERAPELPVKRVVFLGDQQQAAWPAETLEAALARLPELQVAQVGAGPRENVWVSSFRLQDGVADVETPAVFRATIRYEGGQPLPGAQVTLSLDGVPAASRTIDLEPGQTREVEFKQLLNATAEPGRPSYVHAAVAVDAAAAPDRLPSDNRRYLAVPVVAGLPVVFVDQHGADEDLSKNRVGETYPLRRLLAPRASENALRRQLIDVRHTTVDRLDRQMLRDARLVVVAGVADPGPAVPLLRQYVRQGGPLIIAAGGRFDPIAWNEMAWLDGAGILPAPLKAEPVGRAASEVPPGGQLKPFQLDFHTMDHPYFLLEGEPDARLADLYRAPLFFKAVEVDLSDETRAALLEKEAVRIEAERQFLAEAEKRRRQWTEMEKAGTFGPRERAERARDERRLREIEPAWLLWSSGQIAAAPKELALRTQPTVLAAFDRKIPFLVERRVGDGRVLFFASGLRPDWNTLTSGVAILMFDRICRRLLEATLPRRTFETGETAELPARPDARLRYALARPDGSEEPLAVEALGPASYGVRVRDAFQSGAYRVTARRAAPDAAAGAGEKTRQTPLAFNGPPGESDLRPLDAEGLRERMGDANYRWVAADETIGLEGARVRGRSLWKRMIQGVFAALLLEMVVLAWPAVTSKKETVKD